MVIIGVEGFVPVLGLIKGERVDKGGKVRDVRGEVDFEGSCGMGGGRMTPLGGEDRAIVGCCEELGAGTVVVDLNSGLPKFEASIRIRLVSKIDYR